MRPVVDIVMPVRNAPDVTALALAHIVAYARPHIRRLFLLDNVSSDARMQRMLAAAQGGDFVQVIRHERNVGVWCSINRGLALSNAERVFVVTSDVLVGPTTLPFLNAAMTQGNRVFVSPECHTGIGTVANLYLHEGDIVAIEGEYNGSCWLMDWKRLRETVGWFDPRFYVAGGDTDYAERLRLLGGEFMPCRVHGAPSVHLDKQTRRHDHSATADADMMVKDMRRFHETWANFPEVLARHPMPTVAGEVAFKAREFGGWEKGKVGE